MRFKLPVAFLAADGTSLERWTMHQRISCLKEVEAKLKREYRELAAEHYLLGVTLTVPGRGVTKPIGHPSGEGLCTGKRT